MRFSIITVVKNGYPKIDSTIKSVLNQNFSDYEYIILDGCSDDGTSELIEKFYAKRVRYERRKDKGIYYALNRSAQKIKGDYVINLHAGDFFYSNSILKNLDSIIKKNRNYDFFFSNIVYYNNNKVVRLWRMPVEKFGKFSFLKIPHTSMCIKKNVLKKVMYKTDYKISADSYFIMDICKNYHGKYLKNYFIFMEDGGLSTSIKYSLLRIKEDLSFLKKEFKYLFLFLWSYKILIKIPGIFQNKNVYTLKFLKEKKKFRKIFLQ
jgi:glycosyltransferase involved in cell wall biosynthesis